MKEKYTSIPRNESAFQIGAIIILVGIFSAMLYGIKDVAVSFWEEGAVSSVGWLLEYGLIAIGGIMLFQFKKYGTRVPLFMLLLGFVSIGEYLPALVTAILLIATIPFRWNRQLKFLPHIKAPWLCLLAALIALIFALKGLSAASDLDSSKYVVIVLAKVAEAIGLFMIAFFTQEGKKEDIIACPSISMEASIENVGFKIGLILLGIDCLSIIIINREIIGDCFNLGITSAISCLFPVIAYLFAFHFLAQGKHKKLTWLSVILVFVAFQKNFAMIAAGAVIPDIAFLYIFLLAAGYAGIVLNSEEEKKGLAIMQILVFVALICSLILQIKAIVGAIEANLEYMTPLYNLKHISGVPFDESYAEDVANANRNVLYLFPAVLKTIGLFLMVLFSGIIASENTVIAKFLQLLTRFIEFCKNFFNNVGRKIRKLAKVIATIFFVLAVIVFTAMVLMILAYLLLKLMGSNIVAAFGIADLLKGVLICIISIAGCLMSAIPMWMLYAYGQITDDIHDNAGLISSGNGVTGETIDYGVDEDSLPEL